MSNEMIFIRDKSNTFDDVKQHGLLGKVIRFFYEEKVENKECLESSAKFKKILKSHFQKWEIQMIYFEIMKNELKNLNGFEKHFAKHLVYYFFITN